MRTLPCLPFTLALLNACGATTAPATPLVATDTLGAGETCPGGGVTVRTGLDDDGDGALSAAETDSSATVCTPEAAPVQGVAMRLVAVDPGDDCTAGGTRVETGIDDDGDGVLDDAEVDQAGVICNGEEGSDGTSSRIEVSAEAAGAACSAGGVRIRAGVDANGDGSLSDAEVTHEEVVCNGIDALSGQLPLVDIVDEPAGQACANGGIRVRSGTDRNGDHALDTTEVAAERVVCNGATSGGGAQLGPLLVGDYAIHNAVDVSLVASVEEITGSLDIVGDLTSVSLPLLREVGQSLNATSTTLSELQVPALARVGDLVITSPMASVALPSLMDAGTITIGGSSVTSVQLPTLQRVDNASIGGSTITTLNMPALQVSGPLYIVSTAIETLSLPALQSAGRLSLNNNAALIAISVPLLQDAPLDVERNAALAEISLAALQEADVVTIRDNRTLASISLTALQTASYISITNNASLTAIEPMSSLTTCDTISITNNAALTTIGEFSSLRQGRDVQITDSGVGTGTATSVDTGTPPIPGVPSVDMHLYRNPMLFALPSFPELTHIGDLVTDVGGGSFPLLERADVVRISNIDRCDENFGTVSSAVAETLVSKAAQVELCGVSASSLTFGSDIATVRLHASNVGPLMFPAVAPQLSQVYLGDSTLGDVVMPSVANALTQLSLDTLATGNIALPMQADVLTDLMIRDVTSGDLTLPSEAVSLDTMSLGRITANDIVFGDTYPRLTSLAMSHSDARSVAFPSYTPELSTLSINDTSGMTSIDGFGGTTALSFYVRRNPDLISISGFGDTSTIMNHPDHLEESEIADNSSLTTIGGFSRLTDARQLRVSGNAVLCASQTDRFASLRAIVGNNGPC